MQNPYAPNMAAAMAHTSSTKGSAYDKRKLHGLYLLSEGDQGLDRAKREEAADRKHGARYSWSRYAPTDEEDAPKLDKDMRHLPQLMHSSVIQEGHDKVPIGNFAQARSLVPHTRGTEASSLCQSWPERS